MAASFPFLPRVPPKSHALKRFYDTRQQSVVAYFTITPLLPPSASVRSRNRFLWRRRPPPLSHSLCQLSSTHCSRCLGCDVGKRPKDSVADAKGDKLLDFLDDGVRY